MSDTKSGESPKLSESTKRVAEEVISDVITTPITSRLAVRRVQDDSKESDAFIQDRLRDLDDRLKR